jgi:hypothetical protein
MTAKRKKREWPPWWNWELEIVDHVHFRMETRDFTEISLRRMMEHATNYHPDIEEGRWVIETTYRRQNWEIIVDPIPEREILVVVTAYDVWE